LLKQCALVFVSKGKKALKKITTKQNNNNNNNNNKQKLTAGIRDADFEKSVSSHCKVQKI